MVKNCRLLELADKTKPDSEMLSNSASTYYKSYDVTFYHKPQQKQYNNTKRALPSSTLIHETLRQRFVYIAQLSRATRANVHK
ncbi:hypothetical protein T11_9182 [Trichinella zimbabwensis]|uniref:Uncharacterized protein n=1 Tax=Trichinella zimbabwensis TaxID=268475 RepID=A0A0V1GL00_9BILA|nr:hypothetical protein T11_1427 [Trichinella zimbabwensis]KRY98867.1 hypothetical protein T11_4189 [Trichinella zimbabwensis]KRY98869.1 hypothetical protein T11_11052 [Trichinella zimbabwensis]KRY98892.1 hypothetical protein T11_9182 [Trichinella zimbabwensis]